MNAHICSQTSPLVHLSVSHANLCLDHNFSFLSVSRYVFFWKYFFCSDLIYFKRIFHGPQRNGGLRRFVKWWFNQISFSFFLISERTRLRSTIFTKLHEFTIRLPSIEELTDLFAIVWTFQSSASSDNNRITVDNMSDLEKQIGREYVNTLNLPRFYDRLFVLMRNSLHTSKAALGLIEFRCEILPIFLAFHGADSSGFFKTSLICQVIIETRFLIGVKMGWCDPSSFTGPEGAEIRARLDQIVPDRPPIAAEYKLADWAWNYNCLTVFDKVPF